jgi:hypothetical protein
MKTAPKHYDEGDGTIHLESANGDDRTLCGVILEGIEARRAMTTTHFQVNCRDCIGIVEHCYRVRPGAMVITRRAQR